MKERIEYIDIGKGCAILLMVMGHIIAWEYPKEFIQDSGLPAYNFSLFHFIYAFHMSLFFFFSGFVFKLRTVDFKIDSFYSIDSISISSNQSFYFYNQMFLLSMVF